jgi:hypothetical protein
MMDFESALIVLKQDIQGIVQLETERLNILNSPIPPGQKDERASFLAEEIERRRKMMLNVLQDVVNFPPQHTRHSPVLDQFHQTAKFNKSIFVMTKFPDANAPAALNAELNAVIQAVRDAVTGGGYVARLASDAQYHGILWDNVELYLLGCFRGIAIVEDKYLPELNPNVAMEWGWMRGMGRKVLYLVEKDFKKQRADWGGLIEEPFDWANPVPDIKAGVEAWLK